MIFNWLRELGFMSALVTAAVCASAQSVAPGATVSRDIWHDTWFPEWNTEGGVAGFRNVTVDPNLPEFEVRGASLRVVKPIGAMMEDLWDRGAILVFGWDGSQYVRFGMWQSPGGGAMYATIQAVDFPIPSWVRGKIMWEYWAWYGARSKLTNFFYDPIVGAWSKDMRKSHLAVAYGDTGIDTTTLSPPAPNLYVASSRPTGTLIPSVSNIALGQSFRLAIKVDGNDEGSTNLIGNGISRDRPTDMLSVTPDAVGDIVYTLSVGGYTVVTWDKPANADVLTLVTPSGQVIDVSDFKSYIVTASRGGAGRYKLIETNASGVESEPTEIDVVLPEPFVTTATVTVVGAPPAAGESVTVSPVAASYTVSSGLAAGRTYPRSWSDGATWHAYLGRDGAGVEVSAQSSDSGIAQLQVQAKSPKSDWTDLVATQAIAGSVPNGPGVTVTQRYAVRFGSTREDKPQIPSDLGLAGNWQLRARAFTSSGHWTDWSATVPISVEVPIRTVSKTGQTLAPIDDADWFTASPATLYSFQVWVP